MFGLGSEIATMLLAASQAAGLRYRTEDVRKPLIDELRVNDEFETWWRAGEAIRHASCGSGPVGNPRGSGPVRKPVAGSVGL